MRALIIGAAALTVSLLVPSVASAQSLQSQVASLRKDVMALKAEIASLKSKTSASLKDGDNVRVYYDSPRNLCIFAQDTGDGNGSPVVTGDCGNKRATMSLIRIH